MTTLPILDTILANACGIWQNELGIGSEKLIACYR